MVQIEIAIVANHFEMRWSAPSHSRIHHKDQVATIWFHLLVAKQIDVGGQKNLTSVTGQIIGAYAAFNVYYES